MRVLRSFKSSNVVFMIENLKLRVCSFSTATDSFSRVVFIFRRTRYLCNQFHRNKNVLRQKEIGNSGLPPIDARLRKPLQQKARTQLARHHILPLERIECQWNGVRLLQNKKRHPRLSRPWGFQRIVALQPDGGEHRPLDLRTHPGMLQSGRARIRKQYCRLCHRRCRLLKSTKFSTAFKGKAISQALPPFSSDSPVAICIARFATQATNPGI